MSARRVKSGRRRGLSGLGIVLVLVGLIALAVTYSVVPPIVPRLWPVILIAVGLFGLLRRSGWVSELDFQLGPEFGRFADRQRRIFSWALVLLGLIFLVFTLHLVDEKVLGPAVLVVLGLLLLWRRSR
jgi:uncharacterized membrane protein